MNCQDDSFLTDQQAFASVVREILCPPTEKAYNPFKEVLCWMISTNRVD